MHKKKLKWIKFAKGTTKREKAIRLNEERAKIGLDPYVKPITKSVDLDNPHGEHQCYMTLVTFNNNTHHFGLYCSECAEKNFIAWVKRELAIDLINNKQVEWREPKQRGHYTGSYDTWAGTDPYAYDYDPRFVYDGVNNVPQI